MKIVGTNEYETKSEEQITFDFERSRQNLNVRYRINKGRWKPAQNQYTLSMPAEVGQAQTVDVMVAGENEDSCTVTITGESGPPDTSLLVIISPVPTTDDEYTFTVAEEE
jgi:hypothetical protein